MTTEFHELLPSLPGGHLSGDNSAAEKVQIWIIGSRERVQHTINEFYLKRITDDRVKFTPIVPAPFAAGKYMSVLVR